MAVMCVPMPPLFLALPLRQMMLPFIGPLPVSSQNLAIQFLFSFKQRRKYHPQAWLQELCRLKIVKDTDAPDTSLRGLGSWHEVELDAKHAHDRVETGEPGVAFFGEEP